jgi:DNA-directed RNA polymerase subunit RPC12/RpoP
LGDLQEYKCPCCGGAITFDSTIQKMKCPYCDTEFELDALKEYDKGMEQQSSEELNWETAAGGEWQEGETEGLLTYVCKSCGGEIIGDQQTGATACPYCGNPVVIKGQFSGDLKPDCIIPFKLDKKAAKAGLMKHISGKRLLPKIFKDQNHIDEIKGIYVPFWLFDADVEANIRYNATTVRHWSDNDYDYTETSFYLIHRGGNVGFERVPVDGSSKMADDMMESIEPYQFSDAVEFQTAYLAGYLADRYDVMAEQSVERANERVKRSTEQAFEETVRGYATVQPESSDIRLKNGVAKYALYPVWILNTTWNGEKYTFAMNGQTGKFVGDLPVDRGAATKWLLSLTFGCGFVIYLIVFLLKLMGIM